jgi:hypothetical protein
MLHRFIGMLTLGAVACTMLGCSDPVPAAASAGLTIDIGVCPAQMPQAKLGNPSPDSRVNQLGKPVFSGEAGTTVNCRVTAEGDIFANVQSSSTSIGFRVQGKIDPADGHGTATIGLRAAGISDYVTQPADAEDNPCPIDVVSSPGGERHFKAGAIWAKFTCTNMEFKPSTLCSANGEFAFQRCDQ